MPVGSYPANIVGRQNGHIGLSIVLDKRLRYNLLNTS